MKKDEYCSIFMTTLMIAIPVGAVIILIVYAFGIIAVPKGTTTYDFIKDHGSLIAGIIGIIGVFILVWNQNKTTKVLFKSQNLEKAYNIAISLNSCISKLSDINIDIRTANEIYDNTMEKVISLIVLTKNIGVNNNYILSCRSNCMILYNLIDSHFLMLEKKSSESEFLEDFQLVLDRLANLRHIADSARTKELIEKCFEKGEEIKSINDIDNLSTWFQLLLDARQSSMIDLHSINQKIISSLDNVKIGIM